MGGHASRETDKKKRDNRGSESLGLKKDRFNSKSDEARGYHAEDSMLLKGQSHNEHSPRSHRSPTFQPASGGALEKLKNRKMLQKLKMPTQLSSNGSPPGAEIRVSPSTIRQQRLTQLKEQRPQITQEEMNLMVLTWSELQQDLERIGNDVFISLFEKYPEVKEAFPPFRRFDSADLHYMAEIRAHGMRVLKTVGDVLEKHDDIDQIVEYLHDLGTKHITFNAKPDYVDMVGQQFLFSIESVLGDRWTPEIEQAWGKLFMLIGHVMKEAMVL